jgi:hypothetical protein
MSNIIKFEPKVEIFAIRVQVGTLKSRVLAFKKEWLDERNNSPLDHMIRMENNIEGLACSEIGLEECFPNLKGYHYANSKDSFNEFLSILQKDVDRYEQKN